MKTTFFGNQYVLLVLVLTTLALSITDCHKGVTAPGDQKPTTEDPTGSGNENPSLNDLYEQGWTLYSSQSYRQAVQKFNEVIAGDTLLAYSNVGLAWSYARLDSLSRSYACADSAIQKGYYGPDIYILQSAILMTYQEYDSVLTTLNRIRSLQASWIFNRDSTVTSRDFLLLNAYANFYLGRYKEVTQTLQTLDASLAFDANADGPWNYKGRQYERFDDLLLVILNDFTGLIVVG